MDMNIDNDLEEDVIADLERGKQRWTVPKEFYNLCQSRRKWSITLVVIGLLGQIVQVISYNIFPSQI